MELTLRQVLQLLPIILSIMMISTFTTWAAANRNLMNTSTENMNKLNMEIHKELVDKSFPEITGNNIIMKQGTEFIRSKFINESNVKEGERMDVYGTVDTNKKGVYKIKCVVTNSYGLKTIKYIQVLVD